MKAPVKCLLSFQLSAVSCQPNRVPSVILSSAKDPSVGRYVRFPLGSFARLRMTIQILAASKLIADS
jgi:hypothetical protein